MSGSLPHILIIFLVVLVLIFFSAVKILSPVMDFGRGITHVLIKPIVSVLEQTKDFFSTLIELGRIATENTLLEKQVQELAAEVATLEKMKQENELLRESLGFQAESELELIPAEVISRDPLNANLILTLNRGSRHGVTAGSAVVVSEGILAGIISEVFENTSQVELIWSSGIAINAEILPSGATGIVKGEHGLGLLLDLVPQTEVVNPGDRILTSGLGEQLPKNLFIGEVGNILSSESDLFQSMTVFPAASLSNLEIIFVVK